MKHNHNRDNAPDTGPRPVPVSLEFTHPTARSVCLAGTFNDWNPKNKPLHSTGVGRWWKQADLLPGTYEYCFVVDGCWMPDPLAKETVPNPFGGTNSVLTVPSTPAAGHRTDATNLPMKTSN